MKPYHVTIGPVVLKLLVNEEGLDLNIRVSVWHIGVDNTLKLGRLPVPESEA